MSHFFSIQKNHDAFLLKGEIDIKDSAFVAIVGPSGSGKSTLLQALEEKLTQKSMQEIALVSQKPYLFPHLSIEKNLSWCKNFYTDQDEVILNLGIKDWLLKFPHQLSGGQLQRVALARALLTNRSFWLFDEPLSALDLASKNKIMAFLKFLWLQKKATVFYVTHHRDEVKTLASHVLPISAGTILPLQTKSNWLNQEPTHYSAEIVTHAPEKNLTTISIDGVFFKIPLCFGAIGSVVEVELSVLP